MSNNWALLGYFPLYLLAVVFLKNFGLKRVTKPSPPRKSRTPPRWLRNRLVQFGIAVNTMPKPVYPKFRPVVFDIAFFLRMSLWGLAGLTFYLVLPIVQSLSPHASIGFWPALKANLRFQLNFLSVLRSPAFRILALASLLPLLVLLIGWKSKPAKSGYETRRAIFMNRLAAYPLHAFVLIITIWLSFDPTFSPRHLSAIVPMLSYYYLCALLVGYCADYLLRSETASPAIAKFANAAIYALVFVLPFLLIARNFSQISLTNGPSVHQFARELYADLPDGKSVVLSSDLLQLSFLRAEAAEFPGKDPVVVELPSLATAQYHVAMARKYGPRWAIVPPTNGVDLVGPIKLLKLISAFAEHEPVAYLNPTFGPLFDRPDSVNGFVHHFASEAGSFEFTNDVVWEKRWTNHLESLAANTDTLRKRDLQWLQPLLRALQFQNEPNATVSFLAAVYSKSLNNWGITSQRAGRWSDAAIWFQRSLELNPQNLTAHINLDFNEQWQRGQKARLNPAAVQKQYADIFARHNDWREVLSRFGPVDEPTFLFRAGRAFLANGNTRRAADAFQRSATLAPDWAQPQLWLAQSLIEQGDFAEALDATDRLATNGLPDEGPILAQFLRCRATGLRGVNRTNEIPVFIEGFVREHGKHPEVLVTAATVYAQIGMHEQQLVIIDQLLRREPNRAEFLAQKGVAELQLGRYHEAITTLTTALSLAPTDENTRLSRAIARLGADQLDTARDDYQQLLNSKTCSANALFGLGTIAWRKHETNSAISFYQQYLTNAIAGSPQVNIASERLRDLENRN